MEKTKNKNKKSFLAGRSVRAGGYSVVVTAVALAALIFVNLLVANLPSGMTKLDTTENKLLTLDEQTKLVLSGLDEEVCLYIVCQNGNENVLITELAERYASASGKIKVSRVDPLVSPAFVSKYTEDSLADNSVIVESASRFKVVPYGDMVYSSMSQEEYYYYYMTYGYAPDVETIFAGENAVTSAIDFVTADKIPAVYLLNGHGEKSLSSTMEKEMEDENIILKELNLLSTAVSAGEEDSAIELHVPGEADCVFINAPQSDITEAELKALEEYISGGGKILVTAGYDMSDKPQLSALAAYLGLEIKGTIVVEGGAGKYMAYPYYLLPSFGSHPITDVLTKQVLVAQAHGVTAADETPEYIKKLTPLLITSGEAYSLASVRDSLAYSEEAGDEKGQFYAASAIELDGGGKAVWLASALIINDNADNMVGGGNSDFVLNSFGWLCEKSSSVTVRTLSLSTVPLTVPEASANLWLIVLAVLLPLAALGAGLAVWLKRRNK